MKKLIQLSLLLSLSVILLASCADNPHVTSGDPQAVIHAQNPGVQIPTGPDVPQAVPPASCLRYQNELRSYYFEARPMVREDIQTFKLPYRSARHPVGLLTYGEKDGIFSGEIPFIKDKQVVFEFQANLPNPKLITEVIDIKIHLELTKLSSDGWPKTELICFLDQFICSGTLYGATTWQDNINPKFWDDLNYAPQNTFFTTELMTRQVPLRKKGARYLMQGALELDLDDLLLGSEWTAEDYVFRGIYPDTLGGDIIRSIPVVVADDIFLSSAVLEVDLKERVCVE